METITNNYPVDGDLGAQEEEYWRATRRLERQREKLERRFRSTIDLESYAPESPPTDNPKSSRKKPKHRVEVSEIAEDMKSGSAWM